MSMTLGPIHYWLYGKIANQEELTKYFADQAKENGLLEDDSAYVRVLPPLERIINPMNIHGSLQSTIDSAESRYAALVEDLLKKNGADPDMLVQWAQAFGAKHAVSAAAPADAFQAYENFFLDGMPCDHVNHAIDSSLDSLTWEIGSDVHSAYWQSDAGMYQKLRLAIMNGMLAETAFQAVMKDDTHGVIERK
ncbi:MAG: hypothetical protein SOI44_05390 [Lactimicrobium sp.]|uniref:hypothetical protein n=1 Tax=Lactimicrobium sp. TaxID=2563780 RepID=UPI002F351042